MPTADWVYTIVRPNLLSASETLGDGRISCWQSAATCFLIFHNLHYLALVLEILIKECMTEIFMPPSAYECDVSWL